MNPNTKKLTMMAMFTAIGAVLITAGTLVMVL